MDQPETLSCALCNQQIDLTIDRFANDDAKPVHEECYARAIVRKYPLKDPLMSAGPIQSRFDCFS